MRTTREIPGEIPGHVNRGDESSRQAGGLEAEDLWVVSRTSGVVQWRQQLANNVSEQATGVVNRHGGPAAPSPEFALPDICLSGNFPSQTSPLSLIMTRVSGFKVTVYCYGQSY